MVACIPLGGSTLRASQRHPRRAGGGSGGWHGWDSVVDDDAHGRLLSILSLELIGGLGCLVVVRRKIVCIVAVVATHRCTLPFSGRLVAYIDPGSATERAALAPALRMPVAHWLTMTPARRVSSVPSASNS